MLHLELSQVIELEIHIKALGKERDKVVGQLKWCWRSPNNNNNKKKAHFHQILHCTQKKTPMQSRLSKQSKARLLSDSHAGESSNAAVSSNFRSSASWTLLQPPRALQRGAQPSTEQGSWLSLSILLFSWGGSCKRINWGHQEARNTALGLSRGKGKRHGKISFVKKIQLKILRAVEREAAHIASYRIKPARQI